MNTLIVSTVSYAGMGPYVSSIINSFNSSDPVYFFLVEDERNYFSKNIKPELKAKAKILQYKNTRINKLQSLFVSPRQISTELIRFCQSTNATTLHCLTNEIPYSKILMELRKQVNVLFTIHDLHPHEAKKSFYKIWRKNLAFKKLEFLVDKIPNLITNSNEQYNELQKRYPEKSVFYNEFPTLVTPRIASGETRPAELDDWHDYVLFFGRIELYKGVDTLYNAFIHSEALSGKKLVIAGSGEIYFKRQAGKEHNIKFINRYIADEEIACLYRNASVVVYPYKSATQSGVLSLACFFQTPILASNVPFFKQVELEQIGWLFERNSVGELNDQLEKLLKTDHSIIKQNQKRFYSRNYESTALRESLLTKYNSLNT